MELTTVPDVEIVSTGTYALGSGHTTFTQEDLADAVLAASDPTIVAPRIKLGHEDKRFDGELDAEPAFGVVANMRLTDDGQTIKGDLTNVPTWLAESMTSAFPSRSIEGGFGFKAPSGRDYKLVISKLALLGQTWPGVTSLKDLQECLSANGPVLDPVEASGGGYTLKGAKEGDGHAKRMVMAKVGQPVKAAIDLGGLNRRFATDLADGKVPAIGDPNVAPQGKWWARSVQAGEDGKLALVVDDAKGHLLEVPVSIAADVVTYGAPALVTPPSEPVAASNLQGPRILASWPSTPAARPTPEVKTMDVSQDALRKHLGLAEDADDNAIKAALDAEPKPASSTTTLPEGTVVIDKAKLAELEQGAQAGTAVAAKLADSERDEVIVGAIKGGRISAGGREDWQKRWDANPEETRKLLTAKVEDGGLAEVIPINAREIGVSGDGEDAASEDAIVAQIERQWFPELATSTGGAS